MQLSFCNELNNTAFNSTSSGVRLHCNVSGCSNWEMGIGNKVVNCTYSCSRDDNGKGEVYNKNNLKAVSSKDQ